MNLDTEPKLIGWKVASLTAATASVRYRGFMQLQALKAFGYQNRIFANPTLANLDGLDALVMVKSLTPDDYALAQEAHRRSIPIILDLCDNIFIETYKTNRTSPSQIFLALASIASAIIATTEPLAAVIREKIHERAPVFVVADGIETEESLKQTKAILADALLRDRIPLRQKLKARIGRVKLRLDELWADGPLFTAKYIARFAVRFALRILRALLRRLRPTVKTKPDEHQPATTTVYDPAARQLLWFGFHGAPHAQFGMLDLLEIKEALAQVAREFRVQLVVVSNNREKFDNYIAPLPIPSRYVEWSAAAQERELQRAALALIPNTNDAFSICKSANRTVTALTRNLPVVASATPALEPLAGAIVLDDFLGGMRAYLKDPARVQQDVEHGQTLIRQLYGPDTLGGQLATAIDVAIRSAKPEQRQPSLIVALQLPQDLDLALPVLKAAREKGIETEAWCAATLITRSTRTMDALTKAAIPIRIVPDETARSGAIAFPLSAKALLTITETNLGPHRFCRALTLAAQKQGIRTATMQHGLENVGLTYTDDEYPIETVNFAADRVYLWGPTGRLLPEVSTATKDKCLAVGCPKPAAAEATNFRALLPDSRPVIGIFENLHWLRYSDNYREQFIARTFALAEANPAHLFLLKPHHAGRWMTARYEVKRDIPENLVIADPDSPDWQAHTAPALLAGMEAVITTPSTVALDAARMGLPVAVVALGLDLAHYSPLALLNDSAESWQTFLEETLIKDRRERLIARSADFVGRLTVPGDPCARILEDLGLTTPNPA